MQRRTDAQEVFSIIIDGEEWYFDPLPEAVAELPAGNGHPEDEGRAVRVSPPGRDPFLIRLPPGKEHTDLKDGALALLAIEKFLELSSS